MPAGADSGSLLGPFFQVRVSENALKRPSGAETVSKGRNIYSTGGLFHGATPWHASDLRFEKVYRFSSSFGTSGFRRDIFKGHLYTVFLRGYEPRGGVPAGRISRRFTSAYLLRHRGRTSGHRKYTGFISPEKSDLFVQFLHFSIKKWIFGRRDPGSLPDSVYICRIVLCIYIYICSMKREGKSTRWNQEQMNR